MKISCLRTDLANAVSNVSRSVSSKAAIPALEGVLIKAYDNSLNISVYNLEIGITTDIDVTIQEEGESVVKMCIRDSIRRYVQIAKRQTVWLSLDCVKGKFCGHCPHPQPCLLYTSINIISVLLLELCISRKNSFETVGNAENRLLKFHCARLQF